MARLRAVGTCPPNGRGGHLQVQSDEKTAWVVHARLGPLLGNRGKIHRRSQNFDLSNSAAAAGGENDGDLTATYTNITIST